MKILLVDDEKDIHRSIGDFIGDMGHEVVSAYNGQEALSCLEDANDIGLVFTDIRMPVLDGLKLLQAVRVRFPGLPVVLMTGHGDESVAMAALQHGAYEYLKKPVRLKEVLAFIQRASQRRSLEDQLVRESRLLVERHRQDPTPLQRLEQLRHSLRDRLQGLDEAWRGARGTDPDAVDVEGQLASIRDEVEELARLAAAAVQAGPDRPER